MKPIHLMMQAFGPYASKEDIDFSLLGNRTMFVISGKTGAGKTTIFDGISYAIYGKASGEDRNGPELRSQFANEEDPTEVALEFTLRGKRYYIWRAPQQLKKKKNGEGYTTINAKAELYLFDGEGNKQLLAANVRDVDERIKEIMLIDSNQFRQILMIPQGEFRKLLTSDSKDKEVILQRLFHTEIYKQVEEKLKEEATELKRTVEKQMEERSISIRGIQVVDNEELKSYLEADSVNDTLILPLLKQEIIAQNENLHLLKQEINTKQTERDTLQQSIYEAELILKQLKLKDELFSKKLELENQQDNYEKMQKEVGLGQKAALLAKQEELCHHLKKELDGAKDNATILHERVTKLSKQLEEHTRLLEEEKEREHERKQAADHVKNLQFIKEDVYSFSNLELTVQQLRQQLANLQDQQKQAEEESLHTAELLIKLQQEKGQIEQGQLLFLENRRKIELLDGKLDQLKKYEDLQLRYEKSKSVMENAKAFFDNSILRLNDGKSLVEELEQKWLQNQAAILANGLQDGAQCPVCGSNHHPAPAIAVAGTVQQEDIKAAKQQVTVLEAEKGKAESTFYQYQSAQNAVIQSLSELQVDIVQNHPSFTDTELEPIQKSIYAERSELISIQTQLKTKISQLESIAAQIEKYESNKLKLEDKSKQLREELNRLTIQFTENKTTLTRMIGQIPEELRTIDSYEKALNHAVERNTELIARFEKANVLYQQTREGYATEKARLETVEQQVVQAGEKLEKEKAAFVEKLSEQGFEKYGEYQAAKKSELELQQLIDLIRAYREELRSVTDRFVELEQLLKDVKAPNLDQLTESFSAINQQLIALQDQYTSRMLQKRNNEDILAKVEKLNEELKELEERYKLIGHLHEIAKGQNTYRITFERFVLAAFLDDILSQANGRLSKMTSGRFQLLRKTDRSKGAGQSGLELLVFDQYTGQERHVKTLSGGESFKAALALALGLAEVVQQYAGGVSLETMFIDEGFGTLDPESLEQAIEALIDIQSSGRLVGIISHVPELKERIDARLEVFATQSGSLDRVSANELTR
ncbi:SMC family ATPase [Bacillus sp. T3]|uniref:SMC family ATPase n=1 Tax=Bacillus sp. T3 TaxID=467262 RepID=UPI002980F2AB|nr:SMC family ATPase [Bacillus sp. T3]